MISYEMINTIIAAIGLYILYRQEIRASKSRAPKNRRNGTKRPAEKEVS